MILDPINSITSVNFYKKVAGQSLVRTFLYLAYLGAVYGVVSVFWLKMHFIPLQQNTFHWLKTSIPPITYANGRLSTPTNEPVLVRNPDVDQLAFVIDTGRTDPVTPQMLMDKKVVAYVTSNAMYLMQPGGRVDVYDFSKSPAKSAVIDAKLWDELAAVVTRIEYPATFVCCFLGYFLWKLLTTVFFSLIALIVNGVAEARLEYKPLFNMSAYAQTLAFALTAVLLLTLGVPPLAHVLSGKLNSLAVLITAVYLWLGIRRLATPQAQPQPQA